MKYVFLLSLLLGCASTEEKSQLASDGISPGQLKGLVAINKHIKSRLFDQSFGSVNWSLGYYMQRDIERFRTFLGTWQAVGVRNKYLGENQNPFNLMIWWLTIEKFAESISEVCSPTFSGEIRTLTGGGNGARLNTEAASIFKEVCATPDKERLASMWSLYVDPFETEEAEAFAQSFSQTKYASGKEALKDAIMIMSLHPMFLIHRG